MGNGDLPQKNEVKYLGMHLDKRLLLHMQQKPSSFEKQRQ
jgi:hypothetical protein